MEGSFNIKRDSNIGKQKVLLNLRSSLVLNSLQQQVNWSFSQHRQIFFCIIVQKNCLTNSLKQCLLEI